MVDINRVVIIGRLTRDCEVKALSNTVVCNFAIAVNRRVNQGGNWVDEASYFDIELFGKLAEALQGYLKKGKQVAVEGSLRQSRWEASDGQKRSRVSITASSVQLVGGNSSSSGGYDSGANSSVQTGAPVSPQGSQSTANTGTNNSFDEGDFQDDIPF